KGASHVLRTRSRPNHYERDRRNARALLCPRPDRRVGRGQLGLLVCAIDRGFDFKVFAVGQAEGSSSSAALRSGEAPNDAPSLCSVAGLLVAKWVLPTRTPSPSLHVPLGLHGSVDRAASKDAIPRDRARTSQPAPKARAVTDL